MRDTNVLIVVHLWWFRVVNVENLFVDLGVDPVKLGVDHVGFSRHDLAPLVCELHTYPCL